MSGRLICVASQKGGVGKTTLAVNLALALTREIGPDVGLVQLDLPFSGGALASLGAEGCVSIASLSMEIPDLTPDLLLKQLHRHPEGVVFLPASIEPMSASSVTPALVDEALSLLLTSLPVVVVDAGRGSEPAALEALDRASAVLVPMRFDLADVPQVVATRDFLQAVMVPGDRVHVVLNGERTDTRVSRKFFERSLGRAPSFSLPEGREALEAAMLKGQPLALAQPKHPLMGAIAEMGKELLAMEPLGAGERLGVRRPEAPASRSLAAAARDDRTPVSDAEEDRRTQMKRRVHRRLIDEMNLRDLDARSLRGGAKARELRLRAEKIIARLLDEEAGDIEDKAVRVVMARDILNEALGLGPLEYFLADEDVSEIMVNGPRKIFVERKGKIELSAYRFTGDEQLRTIIERIVVEVGRRIDENSPMVDARLPDGSRVNAVIPPLAIDGSSLTIRKFSTDPLGIDDLVGFGSLTRQMSEFLEVCVASHKNILISGGTGSGKTTLLNVLSGFIPADERIVTIEDSAELQLPQEHVVRLETRPPNIEGEGEVSIRDLVRNSLRMRPDRIVVGECRGGEALDMLQAMNTGHDGSLTTVHANSTRDALSRLETLALMAGLDLPARAIREQIRSAVQVVVQQARLRDGSRKVTAISEVTGIEGNTFLMQDLFVFRQTGLDGRAVVGHHEPTGNIPTFLEELDESGVRVPREIFMRQVI